MSFWKPIGWDGIHDTPAFKRRERRRQAKLRYQQRERIMSDQIKTGNVLVQFGAKWCQPCKTMQPIAEEIARVNQLTYVKIDVEEHSALANEYNIRGVPSFLLMRDGQELARLQASSPDQLRRLVQNCFEPL